MTGVRCAALAFGMVLAAAFAPAVAEESTAWPEVREMLFAEREIHEGAGVIRLEAPERAQDAAVVPIRFVAELPQTAERYIETVHLIIDENPAPLAGVFHMTPDSGHATIETRVRVNEYTHIRAVAETSDGGLYMASRFVKAAGGCSAPALKDHEVAMARLGKMKLKSITPFLPGEENRAQVLISHPNYSGMQMDPVTRHWIPPHYVREIAVSYGERTIMLVEADISLSENPSIRFSFVPDEAGALAVEVIDSDDRRFTAELPIGRPADS